MAQTLEYNQSVQSVTPLSPPLFDGDVDVIQQLDDEPNDVGGLSAQELKERFDQTGAAIADYLNNELVPAVVADGLTEQARTMAEAERVANESERVANESARGTAETARSSAESGRTAAETNRASAETARASAESSRTSAESSRATAESGRASAENSRVSAESARATAETARASAESARVSSENARATAETARSSAESGRVSAENGRVTAENARSVWAAYSASVSYVPGNKVSYQGSSYLCVAACRSIAPGNTAYWLLIAAKGDKGDAGDIPAFALGAGTGTNALVENNLSGSDANTASGNYSHAEGRRTTARGLCSHAEGDNSTAGGTGSHAEGHANATGLYAHGEGNGSASGYLAHAEGDSQATGDRSHAEGNATEASGRESHVEGYFTVANHMAQHVFGRYNIADESSADANWWGNYVEIVGNGSSNIARSNARTLDWSGNEILGGKLTLGAGPVNAMDAATKQYVDNRSIPANQVDYQTGTAVDTTSTMAELFPAAAWDGGEATAKLYLTAEGTAIFNGNSTAPLSEENTLPAVVTLLNRLMELAYDAHTVNQFCVCTLDGGGLHLTVDGAAADSFTMTLEDADNGAEFDLKAACEPQAVWTTAQQAITGKQAAVRLGSVALSASWSGGGPYTQSVTVSGAAVTASSRVDLQPAANQLAQMLSDGTSALWIENNDGALTAYAMGAAVTAAMTVQCTVTEVTA